MKIAWKTHVAQADVTTIRTLVAEAGVFSPEEIDVARELAEDNFCRGTKSDYHFVLAKESMGAKRPHPDPLPLGEGSRGIAAAGEGRLIGYACYGRIPLTDGRYDLYWIVVSKKLSQRGIATALLERAEAAARKKGGKMLYAETSSRKVYAPAQKFYVSSGFGEIARLQDFYREGDSKIIYAKRLG